MKKKKKIKLCLAASAGGHLIQLLKLSKSWKNYEVVCVTTTDMVKNKIKSHGARRVYAVGECNRNHPLLVLKVLIRCLKILKMERPDVVLSTGAAAGCMICFMAKLTGARIIWMDSITNIERLSLSGRMVRYIADLFLVQWPELASKYKKVEYAGSVI